MKILFYSFKAFEHPFFQLTHPERDTLHIMEASLNIDSASSANGYDAISIFTGDDASAAVIERLHAYGVKYIAVRAVGYDNVAIDKAYELGIKVANVPAYSPYAIAEHAVCMMLALNRKIVLADKQVKQHDFRVDELVGFDLHGRTVGIIGTGRTGSVLAKILHGFGCKILAYDVSPNHSLCTQYNVTYCKLEELCKLADIISIHTPLNDTTRHLIGANLINLMKPGVMLINTARGAIVNTADVIAGLDSGRMGYFGMDVYEKEKGIFFYDHRSSGLEDKNLKQLQEMSNVLITPHQAFATTDALQNIAATTMDNLNCWAKNETPENELHTVSIP